MGDPSVFSDPRFSGKFGRGAAGGASISDDVRVSMAGMGGITPGPEGAAAPGAGSGTLDNPESFPTLAQSSVSATQESTARTVQTNKSNKSKDNNDALTIEDRKKAKK